MLWYPDVDFLFSMFSSRSGYRVLIVFYCLHFLISELQQPKVLSYSLELENIWMSLKYLMLNHLWAVFWVRLLLPLSPSTYSFCNHFSGWISNTVNSNFNRHGWLVWIYGQDSWSCSHGSAAWASAEAFRRKLYHEDYVWAISEHT